jgi:hypothetical protein
VGAETITPAINQGLVTAEVEKNAIGWSGDIADAVMEEISDGDTSAPYTNPSWCRSSSESIND